MWTILAWILVVVLIVMLFVAINETSSKEELARILKEDNQKLKKEKLQLEIELNKKKSPASALQKPVEKIIYKDRVVEKKVEVPIEKVVYKDRIVEKPIEKIVEKRIEVPVEKIVYIEKDTSDGAVVCLDDIKKEADNILNSAFDNAEKIIGEANEEAQKLLLEATEKKKEAEEIVNKAKGKESAINWYLDEKEESLNEKIKQFEEKEKLFNESKNLIIDSAYRERDIILKDVDLDEFIESIGLTTPIIEHNSYIDAFIDNDKALESIKALIKWNRERQKVFKATHKKGTCYVYGADYSAFIQNGILKMGTMVLDLFCDSIVKSSIKEGVESSLNKLSKSISICENGCNVKYYVDYIKLKIEEIKLIYELHSTRERKKEEQRLLKEQQREEAAAQREFERELKKAQKDQDKAKEALRKAQEEAEKEKENTDKFNKLQEQIASLQAALEEAQQRSERVMSMAQQTRQGWVYIISNIGSFGENVYKIGMTRRLNPMERVAELGDASVPFPFDVHAMIFSEDAPALETALHQAFEGEKTNLVNGKKEFFNVPLSSIKEKVKELGYDVAFEDNAIAPQYRDTLFARRQN